jgi:hypothetical protein
MTAQYSGLCKLGGVGLIAYGFLFLLSGVIDRATGPPPSSGTDILAWIGTHERLLAFPSELLFFEAAFLVPGTVALYHSLATTDKAKAVTGSGILAIAISVMALLAIVHGRLVYPSMAFASTRPTLRPSPSHSTTAGSMRSACCWGWPSSCSASP